jgi:hypothetical protein
VTNLRGFGFLGFFITGSQLNSFSSKITSVLDSCRFVEEQTTEHMPAHFNAHFIKNNSIILHKFDFDEIYNTIHTE